MAISTALRVTVTYPAAARPFHDDHVERSETVGQFKQEVLQAFGLAEGATSGGQTVTYTLYHGKTPLDNMAQTMGDVAGDHPALELKLSQQLTQGQ